MSIVPPQYLTDASGFPGFADEAFTPSDEAGVLAILENGQPPRTPVTVAGAGTGLTGARVPRGGVVLSLEKFRDLEIRAGSAPTGRAVPSIFRSRRSYCHQGTLGVILEAEVVLLPIPRDLFAGVIFLPSDEHALGAVDAWRAHSELRLLEYGDRNSLNLLLGRYPEIPAEAQATLLIETEDSDLDAWESRLAETGALLDASSVSSTMAGRNSPNRQGADALTWRCTFTTTRFCTPASGSVLI